MTRSWRRLTPREGLTAHENNEAPRRVTSETISHSANIDNRYRLNGRRWRVKSLQVVSLVHHVHDVPGGLVKLLVQHHAEFNWTRKSVAMVILVRHLQSNRSSSQYFCRWICLTLSMRAVGLHRLLGRVRTWMQYSAIFTCPLVLLTGCTTGVLRML